MAKFFEKLISCPWKAGVPAASQNECEMNVAGTRKGEKCERHQARENAQREPEPSGKFQHATSQHYHWDQTDGRAPFHQFLRGNGLINDPEAVEDEHDCNQNTRRNNARKVKIPEASTRQGYDGRSLWRTTSWFGC